MKKTVRLTSFTTKNIIKSAAAALIALSILTGCSSSSDTAATEAETEAVAEAASGVESTNSESEETEDGASELYEGSFSIGIGQYAEHGSLDNCREGFLQGLAEEGIVEGENLTVTYSNANSDGSIATQIAQSFLGGDVDMICAIATPMAQSAYAAARGTDIPVIYTAVTDPVAAELALEEGTPVGNITGTSDKLPVSEQLEMIRAILPDAVTLGIMYTTSEVNSESSVAEYKELASDYGFEIYELGIATQADIAVAADTMLANVDCITMITDNTVVASLPVILEKANALGTPVFGSEIEQVKIGCLAAMGLDYIELGKQTGHMAAKVLKGEATASEMNYEIIEEASFYGNMAVAEALGIELPAEFTENGELFDSILE